MNVSKHSFNECHKLLQLIVGDQVPNSDGEIHLEKQQKKDIWQEYVDDFTYRGRQWMTYANFCKLWQSSFPHVKIREYKQVSGNKVFFTICFNDGFILLL